MNLPKDMEVLILELLIPPERAIIAQVSKHMNRIVKYVNGNSEMCLHPRYLDLHDYNTYIDIVKTRNIWYLRYIPITPFYATVMEKYADSKTAEYLHTLSIVQFPVLQPLMNLEFDQVKAWGLHIHPRIFYEDMVTLGDISICKFLIESGICNPGISIGRLIEVGNYTLANRVRDFIVWKYG